MVIGAGGDVPHDPQVAAGGVFFLLKHFII